MTAPGNLAGPSPTQAPTPSLTPSPSTESDRSLVATPPQVHVELMDIVTSSQPAPDADTSANASASTSTSPASISPLPAKQPTTTKSDEGLLSPERPNFSRRPSYDLFECIEQSKYKRLSESQARYIFAQVVEAVYYLDCQGITHCDIKDENLVIDKDLNVR